MRDRASPTAVERNITLRQTKGTGDVKGVEISQDGKKVLFAMRGPVDEGQELDDPISRTGASGSTRSRPTPCAA